MKAGQRRQVNSETSRWAFGTRDIKGEQSFRPDAAGAGIVALIILRVAVAVGVERQEQAPRVDNGRERAMAFVAACAEGDLDVGRRGYTESRE